MLSLCLAQIFYYEFIMFHITFFYFHCEGRITQTSLCVCPTEGEGEGGSTALSVCSKKVSTRRLQRGPQDIQGTQSIALPQPVPMSEENERKSGEN